MIQKNSTASKTVGPIQQSIIFQIFLLSDHQNLIPHFIYLNKWFIFGNKFELEQFINGICILYLVIDLLFNIFTF